MSDLPVETTAPDPATTSVANDQTVNMEGVEAAAPTTETVDAAAPAEKSKDNKENGAAEDVKKTEETIEAKTEDKDDAKTKKNGASSERKYNNNKYDKQKSQRHNNYRNESKYDASVLPETDDPGLIRAQVCSGEAVFSILHSLTIDWKGRVLLRRRKLTNRPTHVEIDRGSSKQACCDLPDYVVQAYEAISAILSRRRRS